MECYRITILLLLSRVVTSPASVLGVPKLEFSTHKLATMQDFPQLL